MEREIFNKHGVSITEYDNYLAIELYFDIIEDGNKLIYLDKFSKPKSIYAGKTYTNKNILVIGDLVIEHISIELANFLAIELCDYFYGGKNNE